jgi:hypothetical protein
VGADATAEDIGRAPRARLLHLSLCTQGPAAPTPHLHHLALMAWLGCRHARAGHRLRRGIPQGVTPQDSVHGRRHHRTRTTLRVATSGSRSRASLTRRSPCTTAGDGACRAEHCAPPREMGLAVSDTERCCGRPGCRLLCTPREVGAVQASSAPRDARPAGCCVAAAMGFLFVAELPSPDRGCHRGGMTRSGREKRGAPPPRQRPAGGQRAASPHGAALRQRKVQLRRGQGR